MFYNKNKSHEENPYDDTNTTINTYPAASDSSTTLNWTITNTSLEDRDTKTSYLEMTVMLEAPISYTDVITFHIEYTSETDKDRPKMCYDGFEA